MEQETIPSTIERLNQYFNDDLGGGDLTGSTEVKYFPKVLLGFFKSKTFPMTENLMPDGSVTVNKFTFSHQ